MLRALVLCLFGLAACDPPRGPALVRVTGVGSSELREGDVLELRGQSFPEGRSVEVTLCKQKDGLRMEVRDDGRSFQDDLQDAARGRRRLGLLGMRERVRLIGGQFAVKPNPGKIGRASCRERV